MVSVESVEKTITKAYDSGVMETSTKKESMKCREPHVAIIGHITPEELAERLDKRLLANGFSNRWLLFLVKPTCRVRLETEPQHIEGLADIAQQIGQNLRDARKWLAEAEGRWRDLLNGNDVDEFGHTIKGYDDAGAPITGDLLPDLRALRSTDGAMDMFEETSDIINDITFKGALAKQNVRWRSQMFKLSIICALIGGVRAIDVDHFAAARATCRSRSAC